MPIYQTGKKKNGKMQYRVRINYTDPFGEYCQKERLIYGKKEAQAAEQKLLSIYSENGDRGAITLTDWFEEYMIQRGSEYRKTTDAKLRSNIKNHVLPSLGELSLADLDVKALTAWKTQLGALGYSVSYCRRIYGSLNQLLKKAVELKLIPENPLKNIQNFRDPDFGVGEERLRYYTAEQFICYITAADELVKTYYDRSVWIFFCIAYYTGMRKGEIHALRWSDLDGNMLHVRRSITQKVKGSPAVETAPKNKSSVRDLQIPAPLLNLMLQYKALQQLHFGKKWDPQYRVVYGSRCASDTTIANRNKAWAKAAELEPIKVHDFRHSHASLLANEGINIQEIARRLGHANVQITWKTYAHLYPREEERAVGILNRVAPEFPPKK